MFWYQIKVCLLNFIGNIYQFNITILQAAHPSWKEIANGPESWKPTNYCHLFPSTVVLILSVTDGNQTAAISQGVPGEFVQSTVRTIRAPG